MERFFKRFVGEDKGSVTADWSVFVAGIFMLCAAVMGSIGSGETDLAQETGVYVESESPVG